MLRIYRAILKETSIAIFERAQVCLLIYELTDTNSSCSKKWQWVFKDAKGIVCIREAMLSAQRSLRSLHMEGYDVSTCKSTIYALERP
jgi:hypothetical protein